MPDTTPDALLSYHDSLWKHTPDEAAAVANRAAVAQAITRARSTYPQLAAFLPRLVERIADLSGPDATARRPSALCAPDLLLAEACLAGSRDGTRMVCDLLDDAIAKYLSRRRGLDQAVLVEVAQRVRVRVLVGERGGQPKLRSYAGQGPLGAWLRVVAVRAAYDLLAEQARPGLVRAADTALLEAAVGACVSPELELWIARGAPALKRALQSAVNALPERGRALLRMSVLHHASIDEIARVYGCNRSTAARWLVDVKSELVDAARDAFCLQESASDSEFWSLVRTAPAIVDLSLQRILAASSEVLP